MFKSKTKTEKKETYSTPAGIDQVGILAGIVRKMVLGLKEPLGLELQSQIISDIDEEFKGKNANV